VNREQVITTLEVLANGIQSDGGDAASFDSPYVIRALFSAVRILREDAIVAAAPKRANQPAAAGTRWSDREDAALCAAYDSGTSVADRAAKHGRTRSAVTIRLVRLGKLEQPVIGRDA